MRMSSDQKNDYSQQPTSPTLSLTCTIMDNVKRILKKMILSKHPDYGMIDIPLTALCGFAGGNDEGSSNRL